MKKYLFVFSLLALVAQNAFGFSIIKGSLDSICTMRTATIALEWDFSKTEFYKSQNYNQLPEEFKDVIIPSACRTFLVSLNERASKHYVSFVDEEKNASYKMVLKPLELNKRGGGSVACYFININTGDTLAVLGKDFYNISYGSVKKSWENSFKYSGIQLGELIDNTMKKSRKNTFALGADDTINYSFDFTQLKTTSMDANAYFVYFNDPEGDETTKAEAKKIEKIISKAFVTGVNNEIKKKACMLDNKKKSRYEIIFDFVEAGEGGSHVINARVIDKKTDKVVTRLSVDHKEGKLNTYQILLLENMEESSKDFGKKLRRQIL